MEEPTPIRFIELSYTLAIVSSGIILATLIFGWLGLEFFTNIIWLTLATSGAGLFMNITGRNEFPDKKPPTEYLIKNRVGFRINLGILAIMLVIVVFTLIFTIFPIFG